MDSLLIEAFSRNNPFKRWTISCSRTVALTLARLYFAGCGMVVGIICRGSIFVRIVLFESSFSMQGKKLPFLERGLECLSDCVGEELIWKAGYLRPYVATKCVDNDVGGPSILVLEDEKPINHFLT